MSDRFYLGIDVGTGSVRAGIFDARGTRHGMGVAAIEMFRPEVDFVEQSSDDIWSAATKAVRAALREASLGPDRIAGIGFDGTCSLVALGANDSPLSVSPTGRDAQNVIVWMDHRAIDQASRINATQHDVLRYVGGVISPEMQTPKLLWLREHAKSTYERAERFFDLPDFMTYRATGIDTRSLCTTVCKWTYRGDEGRWDEGYFDGIGLGDIGYRRIGERVRPMGERIGGLSPKAAEELGLALGTAVGVSIIDAHAGGLGLLGAPLGGESLSSESLEHRLALIGGTSSCQMAVSREPKFIGGIWGPYYSAMVPGLWLTEGGQSATGALIDHVVKSHARAASLDVEAQRRAVHVYTLLNEELERLALGRPFAATLTDDLHVLPDYHGNRSPRADPMLRGMVSGLKLDDGVSSLALQYLATIQAIAHGTKHIIDSMNDGGYRIDTVLACGGDLKNPVFVREHADITGCPIVLPKEPEAVLLGAAILGAVASGDFATVLDAMSAMNHADRVVEPQGGDIASYHQRKHSVFQRMHADQLAYRQLMRV